MGPSAMKKCSCCGEEKPKELFGNDKTHKGGLRSSCRACTNMERRARYKPTLGIRKPRKIAWAALKRQRDIVRYGLAVVEALEATPYQEHEW